MIYRGYVPAWGYVDNCSGSETAAFFGAGLLTSYLFLFIDFYIRTYKGPATRSVKANDKPTGLKKSE
jgi:fatty acid elongase 3